MEIKVNKILIAILICLATSCNKSILPSSSENKQRMEWIKDYAFCKCLSYSFGDSLTNKINSLDHSISTLMDISDLWGIYPEIDSVVRNYVEAIPKTEIQDYEGKKPYTFRCLEYRRSSELDSLVNSLAKMSNR